MSSKQIPDMVPPARRGDKQGWLPVSTRIPPEQHERLLQLVRREGRRRTDIVEEALIEYLDKRAA